MAQNIPKTTLNIGLRAELKISEKPIKFDLSTVGGEHSLFKGIITSEESIKIRDIVSAFDSELGESIPHDIAITLDQLLLILNKKESATTLLIALGLGTEINLSNLPLIGKKFSPDQTLAIRDFQLIYTSADFNNTGKTITELPEKNIVEGLALSALIQFGEQTEILDITIPKKQEKIQEEINSVQQDDAPEKESEIEGPENSDEPLSLPEITTDDGTKWFDLKKQFGPVYFQRVGVKYQNSEVWFSLDASISYSGLTLALYGLSIGSSITKFKPKFNLQGLGISYESKGNISIGGVFLRSITPEGRDEYSGALIIKTQTFTLSAIGSYTTTAEGHPSLFIYGILDKPIGGFPFFFVTGLALGFGYNRSFILPTLDQVPEFPLVKAVLNSSKADLAGLTQIQKELTPYIPPKTGEIFLAIGIKFTSFKIIDSFALLVATFGDQFAFNLIGISTLISPPVLEATQATKNIPPLAQIRFALIARFVPAEGTLKVDGKILPDSYIFDPKCIVSGGFAFYSWFQGEHKGDFVLTVGGYHPKFNIPPHYPRVNPLALNWQINSELSIKGSVYFALTASAIMAGGQLEAVWQSGNKRAWFIANAHFIVAWQPYFYEADISLRIGASYTFDERILGIQIRKTISVDVGANLRIWGPKFSGTATIDLKIISLTIAFGDRTQKKPVPLNWQKFKDSFLPDQVCTIAIESGLLRKLEREKEDKSKEEIFIVNPKEFVINTSSVIPIKTSNVLKICFSISEQLDSIKGQLNQNNILNEVKNHFTDNQKMLSSTSTLQKNEENKKWIIIDGNNKYFLFIEKDSNNEDILNVYTKETIHTTDQLDLFGIAPMNINSSQFTQSEYNITINKIEKDNNDAIKLIDQKDNFNCEPIYKNIPAGLWGKSTKVSINEKRFIEQVLSGFTIKPANPPKAVESQSKPIEELAIERQNLAYDIERVNNAYQWKSFDTFSENKEKENIGNSITSKDVKTARNSLLQNLGLLIDLKITLNFCILAFLRGAKNFALLGLWVIIVQKMNEIDLKEFETSTGKKQAFVISPCLQLLI